MVAMSHDAEQAQKLKSYIEGNEKIFKLRIKPCLKKQVDRKKRGTFSKNPDWALDDFIYLAEDGARDYAREFGGKAKDHFSAEVYRIVGKQWFDEFEAEYPKGSYDFLEG